MRNSQDHEKPKKSTRKSAVTGRSEDKKVRKPPTSQEASTLHAMASVLTQEEFFGRVARKAFELYEKRRAMTEVDDWLEAERLVKAQLLSEESDMSCV